MDKYEYNLKLEQMKSLVAEGDYRTAAEIADTINWRKIKNVTALVRAGEIYEQVERYEESRDILLMAYDRSPIGRTIIYRLACVAIKMGNYDEAKEYYREFVEIAPHDNLKYVLKYEINKAQGADHKVLAANLEELKEQEFTEEWGLELAYLYHQAGMGEQCIEACDELILYFGQGPYVERALELKMLYQPLTPQQEEKYRLFRQQKEGITEIRPEDILESGEIVAETVQIPAIKMSPERFNTQSLQEALQESVQKIKNATEKEAVEDNMKMIKRLTAEIPYLQVLIETEAKEEEQHDAAEQKIDDFLRLNFQGLLKEQYDGQLRILVPERGVYEPQVTGQMTIDEVLAEWEKARQAALQEVKQQELEQAKAKALQEAGDIMERLADVMPKLNSGFTPQDLLKESYLSGTEAEDDRAVQMVANMNQLLQREIDRLNTENAQIDEQLAVAQEFAATQELAAQMQELMADPQPAVKEAMPAEGEELELGQKPIVTEVELSALEEETDTEAEFFADEEQAEESEEDFLAEMALEFATMADEMADKPEVEVLPEIELPPDLSLEIEITKLSKEQKEMFSYIIPIKGMEEQICVALSGIATRLERGGSAATGNLIVQGGSGSGKTVFGTNFVKVLQQVTGKSGGKVGKIKADVLNSKGIDTIYSKITGGCLIVENVGELTKDSAERLGFLMEHDMQGTLVILEDSKHGIEKVLAHDKKFAAKFSERINIPIFTNDELVIFAKAYAEENGYVIDEMGVLALYNCISNIQKLDKETTIAEVKEIVDDAITHVETGRFRIAFGVLTSTRFDENDYVILHEKDFKN